MLLFTIAGLGFCTLGRRKIAQVNLGWLPDCRRPPGGYSTFAFLFALLLFVGSDMLFCCCAQGTVRNALRDHPSPQSIDPRLQSLMAAAAAPVWRWSEALPQQGTRPPADRDLGGGGWAIQTKPPGGSAAPTRPASQREEKGGSSYRNK